MNTQEKLIEESYLTSRKNKSTAQATKYNARVFNASSDPFYQIMIAVGVSSELEVRRLLDVYNEVKNREQFVEKAAKYLAFSDYQAGLIYDILESKKDLVENIKVGASVVFNTEKGKIIAQFITASPLNSTLIFSFDGEERAFSHEDFFRNDVYLLSNDETNDFEKDSIYKDNTKKITVPTLPSLHQSKRLQSARTGVDLTKAVYAEDGEGFYRVYYGTGNALIDQSRKLNSFSEYTDEERDEDEDEDTIIADIESDLRMGYTSIEEATDELVGHGADERDALKWASFWYKRPRGRGGMPPRVFFSSVHQSRKLNSAVDEVSTVALCDEIKARGVITEQEINLLKNRANAGKVKMSVIEDALGVWDNPISLTPDQVEKGRAWLMNQYKSPTGKERSTNLFGFREMEILDSFEGIALKGFYDAGNYNHSFNVPLYEVSGNGDAFEYYVSGGQVNITGSRKLNSDMSAYKEDVKTLYSVKHGLLSGELSVPEAVDRLVRIGYSEEEAGELVDHWSAIAGNSFVDIDHQNETEYTGVAASRKIASARGSNKNYSATVGRVKTQVDTILSALKAKTCTLSEVVKVRQLLSEVAGEADLADGEEPATEEASLPTTEGEVPVEGPAEEFESVPDSFEMRVGTAVEMEHTEDVEEAKKIAQTHIAEDPDYYAKLALVMDEVKQIFIDEATGTIKSYSTGRNINPFNKLDKKGIAEKQAVVLNADVVIKIPAGTSGTLVKKTSTTQSQVQLDPKAGFAKPVIVPTKSLNDLGGGKISLKKEVKIVIPKGTSGIVRTIIDKKTVAVSFRGSDVPVQDAIHVSTGLLKASVDILSDRRSSTLGEAVKTKRYGDVQRIGEEKIDEGQGVDYDPSGVQPFTAAIAMNDMVMVKLLYDLGADIDFQDREGFTPLMVAADMGNLTAVRFLLEEGADVNKEDRWGLTARDIAQDEENYPVMNLLEKHGANHGSGWGRKEDVDALDELLDKNTRKLMRNSLQKMTRIQCSKAARRNYILSVTGAKKIIEDNWAKLKAYFDRLRAKGIKAKDDIIRALKEAFKSWMTEDLAKEAYHQLAVAHASVRPSAKGKAITSAVNYEDWLADKYTEAQFEDYLNESGADIRALGRLGEYGYYVKENDPIMFREAVLDYMDSNRDDPDDRDEYSRAEEAVLELFNEQGWPSDLTDQYGYIMKEIDPIMFREGYLNWIDGMAKDRVDLREFEEENGTEDEEGLWQSKRIKSDAPPATTPTESLPEDITGIGEPKKKTDKEKENGAVESTLKSAKIADVSLLKGHEVLKDGHTEDAFGKPIEPNVVYSQDTDGIWPMNSAKKPRNRFKDPDDAIAFNEYNMMPAEFLETSKKIKSANTLREVGEMYSTSEGIEIQNWADNFYSATDVPGALMYLRNNSELKCELAGRIITHEVAVDAVKENYLNSVKLLK